VRNKHDLSLGACFVKHLLSLNEREIGLNKNNPFSKKRRKRGFD